ncbi:UTP--glucose-1-phosphate uridylyltransferase [Candidatus Peregrinibacteria bacterium RIFOXYB2_FULL_32_7]|nr:MAG: UTP--glucose-1-phosphate uridylyltransferase [Candidatus Peregrinibacteria bacterium RIFOXYB2_FULL_32_7]
MSRITKAVFPVGGVGTRFLPATKAQPKEMLPIVDKPVIQYLVEEAVASGIEEIILITGRGKRVIEDHFDHCFELEHNLLEKGKIELLEEIRGIENLAKFIYIRQARPLGDGDAILHAEKIIGNEPFLVLFGDDIVDSEIPASKQLIEVFEKKNSPVMALYEVPKNETKNYGIFDPISNEGKIYVAKNFVEKPDPKFAPSNLGIIGKYVLTPDIFSALKKAPHGKDGELRLIDGLNVLINERKIYGLKFSGKRYDTGDKLGFIKATIDFALKRPILADSLKKYLRTLDLGS